MATIEGKMIDVFTGKGVMWGIIEVRGEDKITKIADTHTNEGGFFTIENVPEGARYWMCAFSQLFQPHCFELSDSEGKWTPLPEEGRNVQINVERITLDCRVLGVVPE